MASAARRPAGATVTLSLALTLISCQPAEPELALEGEIQGTTYHVKVISNGTPVSRETLHAQIKAAFADIDRKLSNYRDDSEISQLNARHTTDWVEVSPEIAEVVDIARQVYHRSNGCYDLTVKPLFDLWGFSRHENRVPSDEEIRQALAHVGMSRIEVDRQNHRLRKSDPEIRIDLSSIAQGYSVAVVAGLLERQGLNAYMVEIGGELKVRGRKADGSPWRIAIEKPTPFTREVQRVLEFHQERGTAVMTAGTYRNFFEDRGTVYSHILDPRTGRPVTHHLLSVSVLHEDPTWADAWDTALLCVGEAEAARIAEAEKLKALLIYQEGKDLKEHMSSTFLTTDDESSAAATPR
ncbi:FAD:protein FMN transferase [Methylolobus aquaticus]|nr:FAD:protein FMN transferase [Methylolobus aquaticus]